MISNEANSIPIKGTNIAVNIKIFTFNEKTIYHDNEKERNKR